MADKTFPGFRNPSCYTIRTPTGFSADINKKYGCFSFEEYIMPLLIRLLNIQTDVVRCSLSLDVAITLCFMVH